MDKDLKELLITLIENLNRLITVLEKSAGRDEELLTSEAFQKAARKVADQAIDDTLEAMTKNMSSLNQMFASYTRKLFEQQNPK